MRTRVCNFNFDYRLPYPNRRVIPALLKKLTIGYKTEKSPSTSCVKGDLFYIIYSAN